MVLQYVRRWCGRPPLPAQETRLEFIKRYAEDSGKRLTVLKEKDNTWWEQQIAFFDTQHSRAWIMVRRIAHTAQHRGEMTTLLRLLERKVHSVYGPSVDTGGLPDNQALTIYAYPDIKSLKSGVKSTFDPCWNMSKVKRRLDPNSFPINENRGWKPLPTILKSAVLIKYLHFQFRPENNWQLPRKKTIGPPEIYFWK